MVNDIANIAFLSERENPSKSDRLPREYLRRIRDTLGEEALTSQLIPMDEKLWNMERFEDFLVVRRRLMVKAINDLMESVMRSGVSLTPSILDIIRAGEDETSEFKASLRWDYKLNSSNNALALAVAKDISSFMNSRGGTLIIGVSDKGEILGLERDFSTFEHAKQNRDGFELHLMQVLKGRLGIEPLSFINLKFETIEGKEIALMRIERSSAPVYLKSDVRTEFYVRIGNASSPLSVEETVRYVRSNWPESLSHLSVKAGLRAGEHVQ